MVAVGAAVWAKQEFGEAKLGDVRRTRRAVKLAEQMARHPSGSLPDQTGRWSDTKASYRLLHQDEVTFEALCAPHWRRTRDAAGQRRTVLMIQDTSELDYTRHRATRGLGPLGDGGGYGLLLHSTLAVDPQGSGEVLGLANQQLFVRPEVPKGETRTQRKKRWRESRIWPESVRSVGSPPPSSRWVHVGDRGCDNMEFYTECRGAGVDWLVRAAQDRRAGLGPDARRPTNLLLQLARQLPPLSDTTLTLRARPRRRARETKLFLTWSAMTVFPAWLTRGALEPLRLWVVRAWEPNTPADEEPMEWVLISSTPVEDAEMARTVVRWYAMRWWIEEYHKCLKSGCSAERRQLEDGQSLRACLGMLALTAVRLLQLKFVARDRSTLPATQAAPPEHLAALASYRNCSPNEWTAQTFWREVAKLGGFLARKRDGDPGWQTIWRGWQKLDWMTLGVTLAQTQRVKCG